MDTLFTYLVQVLCSVIDLFIICFYPFLSYSIAFIAVIYLVWVCYKVNKLRSEECSVERCFVE